VHVRGLAHVERGEVEAEDAGGALQGGQARLDQQGAVVGAQRLGQHGQVGANSPAWA
jgi:hypothetical protein